MFLPCGFNIAQVTLLVKLCKQAKFEVSTFKDLAVH